MGNSLSRSQKHEMPFPFIHKNTKIEGLETLQYFGTNKFVIADDTFATELSPIKYRYNMETYDDWQWEWTPHVDEADWYSVKGAYFEIPRHRLQKYPYSKMIDAHTKIIPVEMGPISAPTDDPVVDDDEEDDDEEDDKQDEKDEEKLNNSFYADDPNLPRVHVTLPAKYDAIRRVLAQKDPIPPHILNEYKILKQDVYCTVLQSDLVSCQNIKCSYATKDLTTGHAGGAAVNKHPVLIFYEKKPTKPTDVVWMLHLVQDERTKKASVEFDCKCWNKFKPSRGWRVSDEVFELEAITLSDIAKWAVRYERNNPDYTELYANCRRFMLLLSKYIKVQWNEVMLLETVWYSMPIDPKGKLKCGTDV